MTALPWQAIAFATVQKPVIYLNMPQNDPIYKPGGLAHGIITGYFAKQLPQYSFQYVNMSYQRFWIKVNQGDDICNVFGLLNKTDSNIISSNTPTFMIPKPSVVMLKTVADKLNYDTNTDAEQILYDLDLFGTYMQGRRLHTELDQTIAILEQNNQHHIVGKNYALSNIYQLLSKHRFDYFIGLPMILNNMTEQSSADLVSFEFDKLSASKLYLVCNQSDKNQTFIQAFDNNKKAWFALPELAIAWQYIFQGDAIDPSPSFAAFEKAFNTP